MYNASNWYWNVAQSATQVYSSAAAAYVSNADATYRAWLASGNVATRIDSEASLRDVLAAQYPAGWPALAQLAGASEALTRSDITVLRCVENGVAIPADWVSYRQTLRAIIDAGSGAVPARPAFPAGT